MDLRYSYDWEIARLTEEFERIRKKRKNRYYIPREGVSTLTKDLTQ